ncbi:MAG: hypothetical protein SFV81_05085 [Pirellulaceae bacterium]|nr:hypothetical protein [Pirellulaceae bacterium]
MHAKKMRNIISSTAGLGLGLIAAYVSGLTFLFVISIGRQLPTNLSLMFMEIIPLGFILSSMIVLSRYSTGTGFVFLAGFLVAPHLQMGVENPWIGSDTYAFWFYLLSQFNLLLIGLAFLRLLHSFYGDALQFSLRHLVAVTTFGGITVGILTIPIGPLAAQLLLCAELLVVQCWGLFPSFENWRKSVFRLKNVVTESAPSDSEK